MSPKTLAPMSLMIIFTTAAQAQTPAAPAATTSAPQVAAPKAPTVNAPTVAAPASPTAAATQGPAYATSQQKAPNVVAAYDDTAFKNASATGNAVLLVFSGAADTIWVQQAPVIQQILREPEFKGLQSFQIDATNGELMARFSVVVPGTLLVTKGGVERIRSTRMVKPDVIRKMLRLHTAL